MHRLARHTILLMLLVVCHTGAAAQTQDLSPLLPAETGGNTAIRQAVISGDLARADSLAAGLPERELWRGILAIVHDDTTAAIRILRKSNAPKALGVAYYMVRQHVLFRGQMAEAIRVDPSDFGPYYYLGRHYDTDAADPEAAARWFRLALERNPGHSRSRAYLGGCLERLGQTEAAAAAFAATPQLAQSQLGLARLRLAGGDAAGALPFAEKAMRLDAKNAAAAKLAARLYAGLQRPRDAVRVLEKAAALAPADATVHYQLFRLYQSEGQPQKAAAARSEFQRLQAIYGIQP